MVLEGYSFSEPWNALKLILVLLENGNKKVVVWLCDSLMLGPNFGW